MKFDMKTSLTASCGLSVCHLHPAAREESFLPFASNTNFIFQVNKQMPLATTICSDYTTWWRIPQRLGLYLGLYTAFWQKRNSTERGLKGWRAKIDGHLLHEAISLGQTTWKHGLKLTADWFWWSLWGYRTSRHYKTSLYACKWDIRHWRNASWDKYLEISLSKIKLSRCSKWVNFACKTGNYHSEIFGRIKAWEDQIWMRDFRSKLALMIWHQTHLDLALIWVLLYIFLSFSILKELRLE